MTTGILGAAKGFRPIRLASVGSMLGGDLMCMGNVQSGRDGKDVDKAGTGSVVVVVARIGTIAYGPCSRRWRPCMAAHFLELDRRRVRLFAVACPALLLAIESYLHYPK